MAFTDWEYVTVETEGVTVDLIVWKLYRIPTTGVVEATMDANPHLARFHRESPFLPLGTQVRIPIDRDVLAGKTPPMPVETIYGKVI